MGDIANASWNAKERTHTNTHVCTYACIHSHMHTHAHPHTLSRTHVHTLAARMHTQTNMTPGTCMPPEGGPRGDFA